MSSDERMSVVHILVQADHLRKLAEGFMVNLSYLTLAQQTDRLEKCRDFHKKADMMQATKEVKEDEHTEGEPEEAAESEGEPEEAVESEGETEEAAESEGDVIEDEHTVWPMPNTACHYYIPTWTKPRVCNKHTVNGEFFCPQHGNSDPMPPLVPMSPRVSQATKEVKEDVIMPITCHYLNTEAGQDRYCFKPTVDGKFYCSRHSNSDVIMPITCHYLNTEANNGQDTYCFKPTVDGEFYCSRHKQ